ncbi:MAG: hypothetical protein HY708_03345, partial [Ignavibacteriae bacterium]|nr:hypothetical protein [Ignavibacteriota bacterium]
VPDDDPSLPFDEKRIGGNPTKKDTDGDGLNDLQEVMAGTSQGSIINRRNTDGDAREDGVDAEPLYPIDPIIKQYEHQLPYFATLVDGDLSAEIRMGWLPDSLAMTVHPQVKAKPMLDVNVLFQIDANNDGWFHGFDNWQIRIRSTKDSLGVIDYYLRDCSSWTDPPKDREDILEADELHLRRVPTADGGILFRIPRNDAYGLDLHSGKKMSIRIGVQTTDDRWVWRELFERNYMMQVELR